MTYNDLTNYLLSLKDDKYAAFSKSLSNSDYSFIGVKIPILKKIIKELYKDNEINLSDFILGKYLEIDYIYFNLSLLKLNDINLQLQFLKKEASNAKSWIITDSFPTFLKPYDFNIYHSFFLNTYKKNHLYLQRTAYILGLKLANDNKILELLKFIETGNIYLVEMAKAWLIAEIGIKYNKEVFEYTKILTPSLLKRKIISKICDSHRYQDETKKEFKSLR